MPRFTQQVLAVVLTTVALVYAVFTVVPPMFAVLGGLLIYFKRESFGKLFSHTSR